MQGDRQEIEKDWPAEDLETLGHCPVCGASERDLVHRGLTDTVFYCAPGQWDLWRCRACGVAYLDPWPSETSIIRAYENYYTHAVKPERSPGNARRSGPERLAEKFKNAELNRRFGYEREPVFTPAWVPKLVSGVMKREAMRLERRIRHLPPPREAGAPLLDVGAGNGDFLILANELGYHAIGLEADSDAIALGESRGLEFKHGTMPHPELETAYYEQVTLNHVIEHMHDPRLTLEQLREALVPGGRIWVQTPNLDSLGHAEFGSDWRGLEPPRHLVLFNARALANLLSETGFSEVTLLPPAPEAKSYYKRSLAIRHGLYPESGENPYWSNAWKRLARKVDKRERANPELGEAITLVARRP